MLSFGSSKNEQENKKTRKKIGVKFLILTDFRN